MSNEKQIGLALIMYSSDYDDLQILSDSGAAGSGTAAAPYWYDLLGSYVKNSQIFICPSDSEKVAGAISSYRFLGGVFGQSESAYPDPSASPAMAECIGNTGTKTWTGTPLVGSIAAGLSVTDVTYTRRARHNGGANLLYLDSHVKWQPPTRSVDASGNPF